MFCGKCGTNNQDGAAFCASCGSPLVSNAQPVYQQPVSAPVEDAQHYGYAPVYVPAAPKKSILPWIAGLVALAAVVVLIICLIGGGHGFDDPKDAALAWGEGILDLDAGDMLQAVYPEMADEIEDDVKEQLDEAEERLDEAGIDYSASNFKAKDQKYDISDKMLDRYTEWFNDEYDTDIEITDLKKIKVTYDIEINGKEDDESNIVTVIEIDEKWYVLPTDFVDVDINGYSDYSDYEYDYEDYDYEDYDYGYDYGY